MVTGHTGFKGGWISLWLRQLGAKVYGLALPPPDSPNLYEIIRPNTFAGEWFVDIRDAPKLERGIREAAPDFVFHLAGQALVRRAHADPVGTIETNLNGTMNLLEAIRRLERRVDVVLVTSDKCYARDDKPSSYAYRESDQLGGDEPYSMSKAACELLASAWRRSFFENNSTLGSIATARGGNVLGGGDYAPDRIVPDCAKSVAKGIPVRVRNPSAIRPWQYVLDCLSGYLCLGASLGLAPKSPRYASAYNFGPAPGPVQTVTDVVNEFLKYWPGASVHTADGDGPFEAPALRLCIDKARDHFQWSPTSGLADTVRNAATWYRRRYEFGDEGLQAFSLDQIDQFCRAAQTQSQAWVTSGFGLA